MRDVRRVERSLHARRRLQREGICIGKRKRAVCSRISCGRDCNMLLDGEGEVVLDAIGDGGR